MYDDVEPNNITSTSPTDTPPLRGGLSNGARVGIGIGAFIGLIFRGLLFCARRIFRGGRGEENPRPIELSAQRGLVETQGYTARQELPVGYQPSELMHTGGGKSVYPPKPDEYQQFLGQGHWDGSGVSCCRR